MQGNRLYVVIALGLAGLGCQGTIAEAGAGPGSDPVGPNGEVPPVGIVDTPWDTPESSMRRLTRREYAASIHQLLGFEPERAYEYLPPDGRAPFDNNSVAQGMSETLASGAERLAMTIAADVVADEVMRAALLPCEPAGASDTGCFRAFVETFTFRAFRRPIETEEIERFAALFSFAEESGDFYFGVETVISAVLQDPRFLFRLEVGEPSADDPQLLHLDVWEVASRLSFLIWGAPPNDWLLQQVRDGRLATPEGTQDIASEMLADERTLEQAIRYHEQWLDYEVIGGEPEMAARFRKEVDALVLRVVGENRPWMEILTLEEAYIDATLATHYGVDGPDAEGFDWVSLSESDRGGLLGQGAFLSTEAQRAETDVTGRGMEIRSRLFCQELVIPADVDVDNLAAESDVDPNACTPARLAAHAAGGCSGCHARLDPIGFGLDQYDMTGGSRTHESDKPECVIDGQGQVAGVGSFAGSAALGRLMMDIDDVRACFVQQMQRFSSGRAASTAADESLARRLAEQLGDEPTYQDAILALVTHPSFAQRRLETEGE